MCIIKFQEYLLKKSRNRAYNFQTNRERNYNEKVKVKANKQTNAHLNSVTLHKAKGNNGTNKHRIKIV